MKLPQDFKEFLELLNAHKVKYLIIGGYAVGFHSKPKFTHDIDIWIESNKENAKRVLQVLNDFGFGGLDITIEDLTNPEKFIQLGREPLRIDILISISGVEFKDAYKNKVRGNYLGINIDFISVNDLIKNKKATCRKKDIDDVEWIKKYAKI
jgi:predicted nucleotidyltransferase